MKLLDVKTVKEEKSLREANKLQSIKKLIDKETSLIMCINTLKESNKKEVVELDKALVAHKQRVQGEKDELERELRTLRSERADLMKPIQPMKDELNAQLQEVRKERAELKESIEQNVALHNTLVDKIDGLKEGQMELEDLAVELSKREIAIVNSEEELKRSTEHLSDGWLKFHRLSHEMNESFAVREKDLAIKEESVEYAKKTIADAYTRLHEEERAVKDKYVALEEAQKHIKWQNQSVMTTA